VPNLLIIDASPRFEHSVSRGLSSSLVKKWQQALPEGTVTHRDLVKTNIPYVDLPWIGGAFTPPEQHTAEHKQGIRLSEELVAELQAADHVVIATPMHNFMISALLKAYIDQIIRSGLTVSKEYEGLVRGKVATAIIATGGDFSPGAPFASANMASPYLRQALGFIGIVDLEIILPVRTRFIDEGDLSMADYIARHEAQLEAAVSARQADRLRA
jgi:FMN-dependent NADH-azoreductase